MSLRSITTALHPPLGALSLALIIGTLTFIPATTFATRTLSSDDPDMTFTLSPEPASASLLALAALLILRRRIRSLLAG